MCLHCYYKKGSPSWGANIPASAQGECFPGDEAGLHCSIDGDFCYLDSSENPEDCPIQNKTGEKCSDCDMEMVINGNGVIFCPECGQS